MSVVVSGSQRRGALKGTCRPADSFMTAEGDFGTFRPGVAGLVGKKRIPDCRIYL